MASTTAAPAVATGDEKPQPTKQPPSVEHSIASDIEKKEIEAPLEEYAAEKNEPNGVVTAGEPASENPAVAGPPPGGPPPPPDGGLKAWLQVAGGFSLFFNTWGLLNTFGVYQTYYESGELFHASSSDIGWIGALQAFFVLAVGFVSGPVFDRGFLRPLLIVGSFGVVFGHMMLSLCDEYWQVILAQGATIGIGAGCLFVPAVAIFPPYFKKNLGLAIGLAAAGSSTGGIIYPIMFYKLLGEVGFGWATRIIGFTALATLVLPIIVMQQRFKPPKPRDLLDWSAFTDVHFMVFVAGSFLGFTGLYAGLFYISYFAEATNITSSSLAFYLVPILNAGSVFGRTLPNWLSDKIGPFNVAAPGALICGILLLCLISVHTMGGVVVVALLFGFFSGIFVALPPVLFVALTKDRSKFGTRVGMGFAMLSLTTFCGGVGSGSILGSNQRDLHWHSMWAFGGVMSLSAGIVYTGLRFWRAGGKLNARL